MFKLFECIYDPNSFVLIGLWPIIEAMLYCKIVYSAAFLGSHSFAYQSLLWSTIVFNDKISMGRPVVT